VLEFYVFIKYVDNWYRQLYPHSFPFFFLTEATAALTARTSRSAAY
jgi:hypothetical protein